MPAFDAGEATRKPPQRDPKFRRAPRRSDYLHDRRRLETGPSVMRNYINATVGFQELANKTHIGKTSLMRMFGPSGNPSASNLFSVIAVLQKQEGVSLAVHTA